MLQPFSEEIWTADGPTTAVIGFRYPTRMAIIRLSNGGLFVWSPIQLSEELRAQVDAVGEVRYLIAPNSLHHLFLEEWKRTYPSAKLYAAPGLRGRRKDITFDGDLENGPSSGWAEDVDQVLKLGNLITTEVVFFHCRTARRSSPT